MKFIFTTGAVDNIDHNPSSRTAKDSFHGTAITLTQHPDLNSAGVKRSQACLDPNAPKTKTVSKLPDSYTNIVPVLEEAKKDVYVPKGTLVMFYVIVYYIYILSHLLYPYTCCNCIFLSYFWIRY